MIPVLTYLFVCSVASVVLTLLWTLVRPMRTRHEVNAGRAFLVFFALTHAAPFAYVEVLTKLTGEGLYDAVVRGYEHGPVEGPMEYYRIISKRGTHAKAIVVGTERNSWGGTDRPVLWLELDQTDGIWKTSSYKVAYSERLDKDSVIFPPYH